ncbi:MAG: transcription antitermination factor NusB, partial [Opitutae bacterium]
MDEDLITNPSWSQRRQNRATAFRFVFQWEMNPPEDANAEFSELIARLGHDEDYFSFAAELVDGVIEKIEVLDSIIRELVDNWEFSRIAK